MTMTLEQTLRAAGAYIAWHAHGDCRAYQDGPIPTSAAVRAAIDAHLAGMGEPVGYANGNDFSKGNDGFIVKRKGDTEFFTIPVYGAPPASGDWNAAQAAIGELRNICRNGPMSGFTRSRMGAELDKLTAALPESKS